MQMLEKSTLILHVIAGHIALITGLAIMIGRKGTDIHSKMGVVYYYSMITIACTATFLSIYKSNSFLLHIGIFVFYQTYAGRKSITSKTLRPDWVDWAILIAALINGVLMIWSGILVLMVFGGISLLLVAIDLNIYRDILILKKALDSKRWLARHIGMMMGAYIGTITAFLTVNIKFIQPAWIVWLLPTFILVPLMQFWTWKYTHKPSRVILRQPLKTNSISRSERSEI